MTDKNWMLNPTAISQARNCINIIQAELGIKLKLSHPQFLEMIVDYIELTDSQELADSYQVLCSYADIELPTKSRPSTTNEKVSPIKPNIKSQSVESPTPDQDVTKIEMVEYRGKQYPKYSGDGEFKGLYRGQARYA